MLAPLVTGAHIRADVVVTDRPDGLQLARHVVPTAETTGVLGGDLGSAPTMTAARAKSRVVYLNRNGVTITPGANDSRVNRSSVTTQQASIDPWVVSSTTWTDTVTCLREIFAPFDITFTETDPGNVAHLEAVFGGSPAQLGLPPRVAGVSPFSTSCAIVEHSMVFTFTKIIPQDARMICEIQAQEIAHSYGLDHELLASDPMTYLSYNGKRSFQNQDAACGETSARPCGVGATSCRATQNSFALLTERLGAAGAADREAPVVAITAPRDGARLAAGFEVSATADDDVGITLAQLVIDGVATASLTAPPWKFATPAMLDGGSHEISITVTDGVHTTTSTIEVTITVAAPSPDDGDGGDDPVAGCQVGSSGGSIGSLGAALVLLGFVVRRRRDGRGGFRL
ncbi:MAG: Ig-like domain-containing protein [Myxococcota bacterium]|nr:Ig-like domain-containing protein [Myxococcota bacterium]